MPPARYWKLPKDGLFYLVLAISSGLVLYLSWRSAPQMLTVWFIPHALASWADQNQHDTIRTGVPLALLGVFIGSRLAWQNRPWQQWLVAWGVLAGLVVLAECGQLFMAYRSCDPADIGWGIGGAGVGLGVMALLKRLCVAIARFATKPAVG